MNDWNETFLGIIAAATAVMAVVQIGAMVVLARVAGQVRDLAAIVQKDIRPLLARATAVADEAHKTAALATAQAHKIDRLVTDLTRRVDETSLVIQEAIVTPAETAESTNESCPAGNSSSSAQARSDASLR